MHSQTPPVVAFPDFTVPFLLYTDASCSAGAVLAQKQTQEKVIAYASHVLTKAERKWSTYDRELWAIVWAVRHFRHYLYKQPFIIVTDHKPLLGLRKIPIDNDRTGRRACWALELDPFEWTVVHKDGHCHLNADAMSRRPADQWNRAPPPVLLLIHIGMRNILPQVLPVHLAPSVLYVTAPALLIQSQCPVTCPDHSYLAYPHHRMLRSLSPPPWCFSSLMRSSERNNNKMLYCQRSVAGKLKVGSHHIGA